MTKSNKIALLIGAGLPISVFVISICFTFMLDLLIIRASAESPHMVIAISEVSLCERQDENYDVIETPAIIPSDTTTISICGSVDVNHSYRTARMQWKYRDETIFEDPIRLDKDVADFISTVKSSHGFQTGTYDVTMYIGRAKIWHMTFQVKE